LNTIQETILGTNCEQRILKDKPPLMHKIACYIGFNSSENSRQPLLRFQIFYPRVLMINAYHDLAPIIPCFPHQPLLHVPVIPAQHNSA
jgi:hypothetical protein